MKRELSNYFTIETLSNMRNKRFIISAISDFIRPYDPTLEHIDDIKTATSEAITNAAAFAYQGTTGKISVKVSIFDGSQIEIKVQDWGCGINNITKALEPLYTTGGEDFSGMGFTIMSSFMDSLNVKSILGKGTTVIMTKKLN